MPEWATGTNFILDVSIKTFAFFNNLMVDPNCGKTKK